jgi:peptidyl-prolyl cis-trans isomerase SurA
MQQLSVYARTLVGLVVAAGLAAACQQSSQPATASPDVWATVDGREIRRETVEKAYRATVDPAATPSDEEALGAKLNLIEELINQDLLQVKARAQSIEASGTEIENAYAERRRNVPDETFQLELTNRGLTPEDLRLTIGRELTIQKLLEREVTSKISVTDADIAAFYEKNKAQFNLAEPQFRLGQIGVTPVKDPNLRNRQNNDAGTPAEAKAKVDMLMDRIRGGTDFAELALDFSEDAQSLAQGGDLGFISASQLNRVAPPLRDAVIKMQPGAVSMVTMGGSYTILMLIAREPAGQRELSSPSVRDGIRDMLRARKEEVLRAAYIGSLRNEARVINHLARQIVDAGGKIPPSVLPASTAK